MVHFVIGGLGFITQEYVPFPDPRKPSWRQIQSIAVPILANFSQFSFLLDTVRSLSAEGKPFILTIQPAHPTVVAFARAYGASEQLQTIGVPVIFGMIFVGAVFVLILRLRKEHGMRVSKVSRLLRLCLFMILFSCLVRIIELAVDHKSKYGIFSDRIVSVLGAFGFAADFSSLLLIVTSWGLIVSFHPKFFTHVRVFRGSLIGLILLYVLIIIGETADVSLMSTIIILLFLLLVCAAFIISGILFLRALYKSTHNAASQKTVGKSLRNLQLRMTIVLSGIVALMVMLILTFIVDYASDWPATGHLVVPILYVQLRVCSQLDCLTAGYFSGSICSEQRRCRSCSWRSMFHREKRLRPLLLTPVAVAQQVLATNKLQDHQNRLRQQIHHTFFVAMPSLLGERQDELPMLEAVVCRQIRRLLLLLAGDVGDDDALSKSTHALKPQVACGTVPSSLRGPNQERQL